MGVGGLVFKKLFSKGITGREYKESELEFNKIMLKRSLRLIETRLSKTPYLCGDEMTIADLSAACELDQLRFIDTDLTPYPKITAWLYMMIYGSLHICHPPHFYSIMNCFDCNLACPRK